jgi:hypothetical protein
MSPANLSQHALTRMSQRGFHRDDLDLIRMIGTEVDDGYLVLNRDRQAAERVLKEMLQQIKRLDGKRVVVAGGRVVTVYRADRSAGRRLVRRAEERQVAE